MSQPFAHDSLLGGLNLLKRIESRNLLKAGERPPYPIIIFRPTVRETTYNMNRADLGVFLLYTLIGFPIAKKVIAGPNSSEYLRRGVFRLTWSMFMCFGLLNGFLNSYYRLTGLVNNGLEWQRKEEEFKKYDFTSDYMQGTIWKFFRLSKEN